MDTPNRSAPAAPPAATGFGALLRQCRQRRTLSQLALALQTGVSCRHLSWLETGRANPSRAMVLRLSARLDLAPRERNALLTAAGYAPMYSERALDDPALAGARRALQRLLDAHEPWPALAVDAHWQLVAHNRLLPWLLQDLPATMLAGRPNVLRLMLHPDGLAPRIAGLPAWRAHLLQRLQRQASASGTATLLALHDELAALPLPPGHAGTDPADDDAEEPVGDAGAVALPLVLHLRQGVLRFLTTVTVFGAPHDLTLGGLAVETLLPADEATAQVLRTALAGMQAMPAATAAPGPG